MTDVVSAWQTDCDTAVTPRSRSGHADGQRWRVWVELDSGAYRLAGVFSGTEGEAVAAALGATGRSRGFALPEEGVRSMPHTSMAGRRENAPGPAPKE